MSTPKLPPQVLNKIRDLFGGDFRIEPGDAADVHTMVGYIHDCGYTHDCDYRIYRVDVGGDARTPPTVFYMVHLFTVKGDDQVIVVSPDSIYVAVPM